MTRDDPPARPFRRRLLAALALAPAAPWAALAAPAGPWAAARAARAPGLIAAEVCRATPELTEGPFYLDPRLDRADVTEGMPGLPVELALQVVDADCAPIPGARVEIWQCDALGAYSGVGQRPGTTFLRGAQPAGADGVARFRTLYPGWYPGRAPHIHFKARLDGGRVLTSQLFFPDALSRRVYAEVAPYDGRGGRPTTFNANDRIAAAGGSATLADVEMRRDGIAAALVVGVDPRARRSRSG